MAHITLVAPAPRTGNQKIGPCGGQARSATPTRFQPGQTVEIRWNETINHPGWYRVSFRSTEAGAFTVLADRVPDEVGPKSYTTQVTLPTTPCTDCTLQLVQVMNDEVGVGTVSGYEEYFTCADIVIAAEGGGDPDPDPDPDPAPDPGQHAGGGTDTGGSGDDTDGSPKVGDGSDTEADADDAQGGAGGCQGVPAGLASLAALSGLVALAARRSRRRS